MSLDWKNKETLLLLLSVVFIVLALTSIVTSNLLWIVNPPADEVTYSGETYSTTVYSNERSGENFWNLRLNYLLSDINVIYPPSQLPLINFTLEIDTLPSRPKLENGSLANYEYQNFTVAFVGYIFKVNNTENNFYPVFSQFNKRYTITSDTRRYSASLDIAAKSMSHLKFSTQSTRYIYEFFMQISWWKRNMTTGDVGRSSVFMSYAPSTGGLKAESVAPHTYNYYREGNPPIDSKFSYIIEDWTVLPALFLPSLFLVLAIVTFYIPRILNKLQ